MHRSGTTHTIGWSMRVQNKAMHTSARHSQNTPRACQVIRVSWDNVKVTRREVLDFLPRLLLSRTIKPCLLVLDDVWNIAQVLFCFDPHARNKLIITAIVAYTLKSSNRLCILVGEEATHLGRWLRNSYSA